jgi:hypothetical protein
VITAIISLIGAIFTVAGKLFDWLYARQLIDAGKTAQQLDNLKGQIDAAQKAIALREEARRNAELNPSSILQPDEFTRPDN